MQIFNNRYLVFITLTSISFQLIGCSSTYLVTPSKTPKTDFTYSEINEELSGKAVSIILSDSTELYGNNFRIENDSAKWVDQKSNIINTVHLKEVKTLVAKNHFLGALKGLGGVVGGLMLPGIYFLLNPDESGGGDHGGIKAVGAVMIVGIIASVGGIGGCLVGTIHAHRYYYEFKHEQKDKKPIENEKQLK
ncbi:MAG: hypothetical protein QME58_13970 [Bacteroidota bacterium]|nr:hypothetical protein [Bacteroidota bacterium]